jgi:MoxR-like ATPase
MSEYMEKLKNLRQQADYPVCSGIAGSLLDSLDTSGGEIRVVGQRDMNKRLVCALLLNEHVLLEGLPGVAKTTAIKNLAREARLFFNRVQFIPDMQPSDLIGRKEIELTGASTFASNWQDGPLFANLVLADEINRAPSKVQAALLESMGERQITPLGQASRVIRHQKEFNYLEKCTFPDYLPGSGRINIDDRSATQFSVFATMNPIEVEGTYPLSEAQLDRFCFKTIVRYPSLETLGKISDKVFQAMDSTASTSVTVDSDRDDHILTLYFLRHCRSLIFQASGGVPSRLGFPAKEKILNIVYFSDFQPAKDGALPLHDPAQFQLQLRMRDNRKAGKLLQEGHFQFVQSGSGPRGVENLVKASLCEAFLEGAQQVEDRHIRSAAHDVLRHRIRMKIQAKSQGVTAEQIIEILLNAFLDDNG